MKTEADKMLSETQYGRRYLRAVDVRYAGQDLRDFQYLSEKDSITTI